MLQKIVRSAFLIVCLMLLSNAPVFAADSVKVTNWDGYNGLQESPNVWVAYFYSSSGCSNCETFAAQWDELSTGMGSYVKLAEINMDTEEAKDVALRTGGMDMETGIPHLRLLYSKHDYVSLMDGKLLANELILGKITNEMDQFAKDSDGYYLKQTLQEDL